MKKISLKFFLVFLALILFWPFASRAAVLKNSYPRLANYFLPWEISDAEATALAKWDLLILDMEVQNNNRALLEKIRRLNPNIIILAYISSQEIVDDPGYYFGSDLRQEIERNIADGWWLRDPAGNKISNWPGAHMLNPTDGARADSRGYRFNDYLPEFVATKIKASGLWDGVFYDNIWGDIAWLNSGNIDLNNDGRKDSGAEADKLWSNGVKKMLAKTRTLTGNDFIILGNGKVYDGYQTILNGMMLEDFPSVWESNRSWAGSMKTYWRLPTLNPASPSVSVINVLDKNQTNYRHLRFGLASTLMGTGFFGFDYDLTDHGQTWWYDEYDIDLGPAQSSAYNLLDGAGSTAKEGLWRRDFKNGIALVNSTAKKQTYVFDKEEFEKIKGKQDPAVNNGQRINYVQLEAGDGLVLLKSQTVLENIAFTNGYFYRVFDLQGAQTRNGFFSYLNNYPGEAEIITAAGPAGDQAIELSAALGRVDLRQNGASVAAFNPYNQLYRGKMSLAAKIEDGYFRKVVIGAGVGGGPQVRVFSPSGKLEGTWFAYDKNLRGGVNVALGDVNGDGTDEVVTGPGPGEEPRVKIFSLSGNLINSFLVYDGRFRGGVNVAVGDLNNDSCAEIVTAPAASGGPHIRVFTADGRVIGNFFAYNASYRGGLKVSVGKIAGSENMEILVGLKNFY